MRRPGFLSGTSYWFGDSSYNQFGDDCVVCEGNKCTNICNKAEQLKKIRAKYEKLRKVAKKTKRFEVLPTTDFSLFVLKNESQRSRLSRLESLGLYVPGAVMSVDYGNLVNFGTTDKHKISEIKKALRMMVDKENLRKYGTSDIKKIVAIEKKLTEKRDAMWKRVYGTKDPDKIYSIPKKTRKLLCDADFECKGYF